MLCSSSLPKRMLETYIFMSKIQICDQPCALNFQHENQVEWFSISSTCINRIWFMISHSCAFQGQNPLDQFKVGQNLKVRILQFREVNTKSFLPITHRNFTQAIPDCSARNRYLNCCNCLMLLKYVLVLLIMNCSI